jgi:tRNA modification GTPase
MTECDDSICDDKDLSAALLTPIGRGAVATIRVQGNLASSRLTDIPFRAANGKVFSQQSIGRIVFGQWGQESADSEDIVVCRVTPQALEIHCHGGDAAVQRILQDLQQIGCRALDWQGQNQRSLGTFETECMDSLSRATTWKTAEILLEQSSGLLRKSLEGLLSLSDDLDELTSRLDELLHWSSLGIHLSQPWIVVLTGRPNVGKSSLINALLGYERAIVFDQPGTTRDVVTAETAFDGWPVQLTDTAGLRETSEELEAAGIALTRQKLEIADVRLILIDLSEAPSPDDEALLADWPDAVVIGHKCDLTDQWQDRLPQHAIRVSSATGDGLVELQTRIVKRLVPHVPPPGTAIPVTLRQIRELQVARKAASTGNTASCQQAIEQILR